MPEASNFIKKETLAQIFSCEFCEISKNTFFYRTPPVAASVLITKLPMQSFTNAPCQLMGKASNSSDFPLQYP